VGRDVGRDEGRDQAAWRDLVARLELTPSIDPADAPWPDRENLPAKPASSTAKAPSTAGPGSGDPGPVPATETDALAGEPGELTRAEAEGTAATAAIEQAEPGADPGREADGEPGSRSGSQPGGEPGGQPGSESGSQPGSESGSETKKEPRPGRRASANRSRIIRPAGYSRFGRAIPRQPGPSAHPEDQDADVSRLVRPATGPRDFALADDAEFDFGDGDRYIPPPLPPMGRVDPVAAGAWIALFGGPAFLLISMLAGWQAPRWTALLSILAFIAGFIVLVIRLGDGPSKRDGPDQGAVV
jgi:hypothetical protein